MLCIEFHNLTICLALALCATPASGAQQNELFQFLMDDGVDGDWFGMSVAVSGTTAIVGTSRDVKGGIRSGSARLYDTVSGMSTFCLVSDSARPNDEFGIAVAISGTTAVVGAESDDDQGSDSGAAFVFDTRTGMQTLRLLPDDGVFSAHFGASVAICGTTAVVGGHGRAYLFDTTTGTQIAKLTPAEGDLGSDYGESVGISGSIAIVGAWADDAHGGAGAAFLFDSSTGQELAKLVALDAATSDHFGLSVGIEGGTAIVGAHLDDDNGSGSGAAYLFDTSTFAQVAKLLPDDGAANDKFGESVGISGSTAIVGAPFHADNGQWSGSAYLFDVATGLQIAKLLPSDGATFDQAGESVAISGTDAIVGSRLSDTIGFNTGSAYLFRQPNSFCLGVACPCGNNDPFSGCLNSTGTGGRLAAPPSTSLGADNLVLTASNLPALNLGLFVASDSVLPMPAQVGDGSICIGGSNVFRFAPGQVSPDGTFALTNVASSAPPGFLVAGELRYFQVWTRDVFCSPLPVPCPSPCGGGSNISNAIEVYFVP